jgi:hypothetical protein
MVWYMLSYPWRQVDGQYEHGGYAVDYISRPVLDITLLGHYHTDRYTTISLTQKHLSNRRNFYVVLVALIDRCYP